MTNIFHRLLSITISVVFCFSFLVSVRAQIYVPPSVPDNKNKSISAEYPSLPDSIMDAELTKIDGTKYRLSDLRGKVVLLNLWGLWCGPCRTQMPGMVKLQKKYESDRFAVVGLNIGDEDGAREKLQKIKVFSQTYHINYDLVRSPSKELINDVYKISTQEVVPQSFLIGIDGSLRGIFTGGGSYVDTRMFSEVEKTVTESKGKSILEGSITDTFGAVIPQALITAQASDGTKYETHTNFNGKYSLMLPPDSYSITVSYRQYDAANIPKYQLVESGIMTLDMTLTCKNCIVVN